MLNRKMALAVSIILGGPLAACTYSVPGQGATSSDAAYCDRLIEIYNRYLSGDEFAQRRPAADVNLDGRVAVARCQQGDTAAGIPVLERKLIANGFTLPRRS